MVDPSPEMLAVERALERVLETVPAARSETTGLGEAPGRVLAEDVRASEPWPADDHSAMDGFGVRSADLATTRRLILAGDSLAGVPFRGRLDAGQCARVMTGALIPEGADAVVPVERTSGYEPAADGRVGFDDAPAPGANIRRRGSVRAAGSLLLRKGTRIRPAQVGVLAQQGRTAVPVGVRPRVAVLPTGDEIVEVGATPQPGQVRNSNAWALVAQVAAAGGLPVLLPVLRDDPAEAAGRLGAALADHDLVCTIGGVSMGTHDRVRGAFADLGGETLVGAVRVKPGKPVLFGRLGPDRCLLGLPGNPASAFTIFALLGAPWVRAFQGIPAAAALERRRARLAGAELRPNARLQALPARLRLGGDGVVAAALPQRTSADLFSLAEADALFLVPPDEAPAEGGLVDWVDLP